jgi:hypothetical protein
VVDPPLKDITRPLSPVFTHGTPAQLILMRAGKRGFRKLLPIQSGFRLVVAASEVQAVEGGRRLRSPDTSIARYRALWLPVS